METCLHFQRRCVHIQQSVGLCVSAFFSVRGCVRCFTCGGDGTWRVRSIDFYTGRIRHCKKGAIVSEPAGDTTCSGNPKDPFNAGPVWSDYKKINVTDCVFLSVFRHVLGIARVVEESSRERRSVTIETETFNTH
eukprot:1073493-Amphidinium_carterae.3